MPAPARVMEVRVSIMARSQSSHPLRAAAMIMAYFMHLKFEISRMRWMTMCALVACLALMMIFFPDALRILTMSVK